MKTVADIKYKFLNIEKEYVALGLAMGDVAAACILLGEQLEKSHLEKMTEIVFDYIIEPEIVEGLKKIERKIIREQEDRLSYIR